VNTANAEAARASVEAARAEAARYQAMEGFKNVVAPFDGVVTARSTDVGSYVNATGAADHSSGPASELFMVSDIHKLRVYVSVPQDYSGVLKPGLTATMSLPQFSHQQFHAQFLTTAQAFNPQTRTVVTELTVDNPNNRIWPGTYADVHFVVPGDPHVLVIPEQALLFRAEGLQVAVVRPDNTVHLQNVTLGLNLGKTVQITAGLQPNDRLIDDPSAATLEGEKVRVVPAAAGDDSSSPQGSAGKLSQAGAAGQSPQGGGQEPVHTAQADRAPADTQADTPQADTPQAGTPRAGTPQAGTPQAGGPRSHGSSAP
jgi:RND family efflux transporter MFP subunit